LQVVLLKRFIEIIDTCVGNTHTVHKKRLDTLISEKVQFFNTEAALIGNTLDFPHAA
jgi:hydrogenase maturation factor